MLSNANKLKAEFVRFQDLDGFTGSYDRELQGEAAVTMTGPTYHITGTALGYNRRRTDSTNDGDLRARGVVLTSAQLRRKSTM